MFIDNDNSCTPFVTGNRFYSARTKHVALRFFNIRERVKEGKIRIHHVPTQDQLVDIRTKRLNKATSQGPHQQNQRLWSLNGTGGPVKDLGAFAGSKLCCVGVRRPTRHKH